MNWNPKNIELLKNLWTAGHRAGQIAVQLDCSRSAVSGKVTRLGPRTQHSDCQTQDRISAEAISPGLNKRPNNCASKQFC
jgi:GcrA cell cycle regulator